jgi:hypothetical protein
MRRILVAVLVVAAVAGAVASHTVLAQPHPTGSGPRPEQGVMPSHGTGTYGQHMAATRAETGGVPTQPGQDAFGAIAEIVRILDGDPATDWARVDIERLRQHLIDMNEVVLRAAVAPAPVPGGLAMEITGTGRTEQAIRAMVVPHAVELDRMPSYAARTEPIAGGVRLTVVARRADDRTLVARIRGLGFAGLLTEGAHHQAHHLAMARGQALAGHSH